MTTELVRRERAEGIALQTRLLLRRPLRGTLESNLNIDGEVGSHHGYADETCMVPPDVLHEKGELRHIEWSVVNRLRGIRVASAIEI